MDKKQQEGDKLFKEGEEALRTRFLIKRKPDWQAAAPLFEKAAIAFKNAKLISRAKESFIKAAECYSNLDSAFTAGQKMEEAAKLTVDADYKEAADLYYKAASHYHLSGKHDKAAQAFTKGGKVLEKLQPARAVEFYNKAIELLVEADKEIFTPEIFRNLVGVQVKEMKYFDAIETLERQNKIFDAIEHKGNSLKNFLGIVVLRLQVGDFVAAENMYTQCLGYPGFLRSPEANVCDAFITAFEEHDNEKLKKAQTSQVLNYLDPPPLSNLARSLVIPDDFMASSATRVQVLTKADLDAMATLSTNPQPADVAAVDEAFAAATTTTTTTAKPEDNAAAARAALFAPVRKAPVPTAEKAPSPPPSPEPQEGKAVSDDESPTQRPQEQSADEQKADDADVGDSIL